jgi:hypothetical protein
MITLDLPEIQSGVPQSDVFGEILVWRIKIAFPLHVIPEDLRKEKGIAKITQITVEHMVVRFYV